MIDLKISFFVFLKLFMTYCLLILLLFSRCMLLQEHYGPLTSYFFFLGHCLRTRGTEFSRLQPPNCGMSCPPDWPTSQRIFKSHLKTHFYFLAFKATLLHETGQATKGLVLLIFTLLGLDNYFFYPSVLCTAFWSAWLFLNVFFELDWMENGQQGPLHAASKGK